MPADELLRAGTPGRDFNIPRQSRATPRRKSDDAAGRSADAYEYARFLTAVFWQAPRWRMPT